MAILGTLAQLKEYFKGWHTKYYDELHKKYASLDHPSQKATETEYGHVKLTNECKNYEDGLALSSGFGCTVNTNISNLQEEVNKLKKDMVHVEPIRMKIGKIRDPQNRNLQELSLYCNNGNSSFEMDMQNKTIGAWGASKVMFDAQCWGNQPDKLVIQLLEPDGNYVKSGKTVFIKLNGVWYPRTTNDVGAVIINVNFGAAELTNSINKFTTGQTLTNDERNDIRNVLIGHCGKWRMMEVVSNSNFDDTDIRYENTYNTISKKFLYIFGENLWSYILGNPTAILPEANDAAELDIQTYLSTSRSDERSSMLKDAEIIVNNSDGTQSMIGYKLSLVKNGEKRYYRYFKKGGLEAYPYGYPDNNDVSGSGF